MNDNNRVSFISESDFGRFLETLNSGARVFAPYPALSREGEESYFYEPWSPGKPFIFRGYRPAQPIKSFLFKGRVKVAEYPSGNQPAPDFAREKTIIVGAAACDAVSLRSLDAVFLDEAFTDIFYRERRNNTFIITADCVNPRSACFCTQLGNAPYPKTGFDLNMSAVEGGYLIETGSEKGSEVVRKNSPLFSAPGENLLRARDDQRSETTRIVERQNGDYSLSKSFPELLAIQRESDSWFGHVRTCVECGACLFSCPTCHCFLLYDQKSNRGGFERVKEWDVCIYAGFSRMAGGSSPRLGLMERFRHRYLHKLEYYPKNFGFEACTGCGRCIEGCMGKIDMRKVLKALDTETIETGTKHE
ncbi:4Fe-4S dicluster domain-containing protein [bacterium]|nr:4Fe-4S dicluster domain-containing protein [bacterium]